MTPPAAAAAAPVHRGRVAAPPRTRIAPPRPRRVSGPVRRPLRPGQQAAEAERGLALGALALWRGLSGHRALDRLIRGRIWIALIAFALIGIVTLQLLVLQLNASIGRALVHEAQLQRENTALSIQDSELASGERVESQAARLGMELVPEGALRFLTADPRVDIARAAAALSTPVHASGSTSGSGEAVAASAGAVGTQGSGASAGASGASAEQAATATAQSGETSASASGEAGSSAVAPASPSTPAGSAAPASAPTGEAPPAASTGATAASEAPPAGGAGASAAAGAAGGTQSTGAG